ncbi:asparagine synthetase A [Nonomuraea sp. NBC_01738]|uniref:asparagine synthetase A n=1 Tax=Nonomuraea sp. NBC_01738 TaxID=2976003 RepID=UPI002E140514|nr:asparagine synthetase A [Nonomuraea sp. NBC_01738]
MSQPTITAPRSWAEPAKHFLTVLENPWYQRLTLFQDIIAHRTTDFWTAYGARYLNLPITTGSISSPMGRGSDSTPVKVQLEGVPTYLADSMQFMLEFGCRLAPEGAYYLMPSFRGEPADQTHLCQFFHSEAEIAGGLDTVMTVVEEYLRHLAAGLLAHGRDALLEIAGSVDHVERLAGSSALPRVTFDEAAARLGEGHVREQEPGCRSLTRAGERALMEQFGGYVWVTHMDHLSVPFYQAFDPANPARSLSADLLFGIGETVGAGERHTGVEELERALALHEVPAADYQWYVTMKERYPLRTSGFGLGIERFLLWAMKHDDIRDLALLLRFNGQQILP